MMDDPWVVLGVAPDASEEEIRQRYLELVRKHPPERDAQEFTRVRAAYDQVRDPIHSLERRLFGERITVTFDELLNRSRPDIRQQRIPVDILLTLGDP